MFTFKRFVRCTKKFLRGVKTSFVYAYSELHGKGEPPLFGKGETKEYNNGRCCFLGSDGKTLQVGPTKKRHRRGHRGGKKHHKHH